MQSGPAVAMLSSALEGSSAKQLGRFESVALLAALMSLNAIGIDAMVPALPQIGRGLGITAENQQQLIVLGYMLGFGAGQIFWGPLADRFGRKPILVAGIGLYALFALGCIVAPSFALFIALRAAMGAAAASTRTLVTAMVRDLFEGEEMAQVMSLVFMVFMIVPVLAPSLGTAVLLVAPWQAIFWMFALYAGLLLGWGYWRLPETLHPDYRRALNPAEIIDGVRKVFSDRLAIGYTLASTALFGALSAYVASIQQVVADVFHAADRLPLVFAGIAAPMALAAWLNSKVVGRLGLRRVGHAGLIAYLLIAIVHWQLARNGSDSLLLFVILQGLALMAFAFCSANFSTLAMTNMGELAGTASSVQGVISTIGGASIGLVIGQAFNGTTVPLMLGFTLSGAAALALIGITERGRLLRPLAT